MGCPIISDTRTHPEKGNTMSIRLYASVLLALTISPTLSLASSFGPPDGFAGNPPNNSNCTLCHSGADINSGDGALELLGLPAEYTPNETYTLTVQLGDPEQDRWGFEVTVLDVNDPFVQGGQLLVTDKVNTQISLDFNGTEDFLKQTSGGTQEGVLDGPVSWVFDWTAPDALLEGVAFYVAGNAANADHGTTGDFIYVSSYSLDPSSPTPVEESTWGSIKALYGTE